MAEVEPCADTSCSLVPSAVCSAMRHFFDKISRSSANLVGLEMRSQLRPPFASIGVHACCVGGEDLSVNEQGRSAQGFQRLVLELSKQRVLVWTADKIQRRQRLCGHLKSNASIQRGVCGGDTRDRH